MLKVDLGVELHIIIALNSALYIPFIFTNLPSYVGIRTCAQGFGTRKQLQDIGF